MPSAQSGPAKKRMVGKLWHDPEEQRAVNPDNKTILSNEQEGQPVEEQSESQSEYCESNSNLIFPQIVTETTEERQDFLIMGKDACHIIGLLVYQKIISASCHKELTVLTQVLQLPLVIPAGKQLTTAISVSTTATCRAIEAKGHQCLAEDSDLTPEIFWTKYIGHERPQLTCSLKH
ncbi:hypothetical protein Nmel_007665 [Mimus melanotis]